MGEEMMATEKRLINATPIIDECKECSVIEWNKCVHTTWAEAEEEFMQRLLDAPVVDAVEVVHGEWRTKILCGGFAEEWGYVCSVCGCTVSDRCKLSFGKFATGNQKLNYCPNCGAKMDGNGNA